MMSLRRFDSLEVTVVVDNEVDPLSSSSHPGVQQSGQLPDITARNGVEVNGRGAYTRQVRMNDMCCGGHGLSLMITGKIGNEEHTVLFDTGPTEDLWEQNAQRLRIVPSKIDLIQLSHWHRDHSGGMLKAVRTIYESKSTHSSTSSPGCVVDLHPSRPPYRGFMGMQPISFEADPTFEDIEAAGGRVSKSSDPHLVLDDTFLISGFIPRETSYEQGVKRGIRFNPESSTWEKDELIADERLLVCHVKDKGLVVFTGCSHAGVVNTSRHALSLTEHKVPLFAVLGGYHLAASTPEDIKMTVADLKALDAQVLIPGHCSGWRVKHEIEKEMPGRLVPSFVGSCFKI